MARDTSGRVRGAIGNGDTGGGRNDGGSARYRAAREAQRHDSRRCEAEDFSGRHHPDTGENAASSAAGWRTRIHLLRGEGQRILKLPTSAALALITGPI